MEEILVPLLSLLSCRAIIVFTDSSWGCLVRARPRSFRRLLGESLNSRFEDRLILFLRCYFKLLVATLDLEGGLLVL